MFVKQMKIRSYVYQPWYGVFSRYKFDTKPFQMGDHSYTLNRVVLQLKRGNSSGQRNAIKRICKTVIVKSCH